MRQRILLHGIDQLVLCQEVSAAGRASILYDHNALKSELRNREFIPTYRGMQGGKTKLRFRHLDLRYWRHFGKFHLEVRPSSESLTCWPKESWTRALGLYDALGSVMGFAPRPEVMSLDIFFDIACLWVSESLLKRIVNKLGLRHWASPELGERNVIFGRPKRFCMYDKLLETLLKPSKQFVRSLWEEQGWNGTDDVARIDLRFAGKRLRAKGAPDLNALCDEALSHVVLTRKQRNRDKWVEDNLWKRIKAIDVVPPWDAPPSVVPASAEGLGDKARHAMTHAWWSVASLVAIEAGAPYELEPWARCLAQSAGRLRALDTKHFRDKIAEKAEAVGLGVPLASRRPALHLVRTTGLPQVGVVGGSASQMLFGNVSEDVQPSRARLS